MKYSDCQRADGNCAVCSLSNYNRDCNNNTINKLAFYRGLSGLSQSQLAKKTGVSVRMIQNYEQGQKPIGKAAAETVAHLAKAVGKTVEDLL